MIHDDLNVFADEQQATATGVSEDVYDNSFDNNLGIGEPMSCVITVDVDADVVTGDETYEFQLQTSDTEAFTVATVIASQAFTNAQAVTDLLAGSASIVLAIPQDERGQRYWRVRHVLAGTTPDITYSAVLQPTHGVEAEVRGGYPNNSTIT